MTSKYPERDIARLEMKIQKAVQDRKEKRQIEKYTTEKIRNLYSFLDKVESDHESVMSTNSVVLSEVTNKKTDNMENSA